MDDPKVRAAYLLRVVAKFIEENPLAPEMTVYYDEAECDGYCLKEDCLSAVEALERLR
jgi:hypothetical protein